MPRSRLAPAETATPNVGVDTVARRRSRVVARFRANRFAVAASIFLLALIVVAAIAPWLARYDPDAQHLVQRLESPSGRFWLGTDGLGRDIFSRLIYGTRISLVAATESLGIALVLGVPLGLLAGYRRGLLDRLVGTVADTMLSLPPLVIALAIIGVRGPGLTNAMVAVGIVLAPRFFRVARGAAMAVSGETYVEGCRSIGCTTWRVLSRHLLPNASGPLLVQISFSMGFVIVAEASLSFLGLGVQPPSASWGSMVQDASTHLYVTAWPLVPPSVTIALVIVALSVIGDGLRDALGRDGDRR
jgi:peptide/nickel transport system permease protein